MFITFVRSAVQIQQILKQKLSEGLQSVAGVIMCDRPLFQKQFFMLEGFNWTQQATVTLDLRLMGCQAIIVA